MANIYKSKYTGEQIEDILDKADGISVQSGATDEEFEGITIDGKTYHLPQQEHINVVANPSTTPTEELTKVEIGNTTYSIPQPQTVVANPSGSGSNNLNKLQVGNTIYNVPQPVAPTTVVANPQGDATAELDKLRVGDVIYETPRPIDVVANPIGVGDTDLTKLRVGSTIYNIPQPQTPTTVIANPAGGGDIDLHSIQVGDTKYAIPEPTTVAANTLQSGTEILRNLQVGSTVYTILSGGAPIEISTEAAMNAVLEGAQVGAIFKYVGATTALYENGALYMVEEGSTTYKITVKNDFEVSSGSLRNTYIKLDTPPTSQDDYTYVSTTSLSSGVVLGENQATKAYIWGYFCWINGTLNDLAYHSDYTSPYELVLTQDTTVNLCYDAD